MTTARDEGASAKVRRAPRRRPGRPAGGTLIADRSQLLDAAERSIAAEGPNVSMETIAAAAEVTKPILYRGVGDKDALVTALAERLVDRIITQVGAAIDSNDSPRDQVKSFVAAYLRVIEGNRDLYLFVNAGGSSDDHLRQSLHLADRSAQPLAEQIAAQRVAAGADAAVAEPWAYGLIGMLHFVTLWWLRGATVELDHLAEMMVELLWSGLSAGS